MIKKERASYDLASIENTLVKIYTVVTGAWWLVRVVLSDEFD